MVSLLKSLVAAGTKRLCMAILAFNSATLALAIATDEARLDLRVLKAKKH